MPFYAVRKGKKPGVYTNWTECAKQVKGFQYAKYRKFSTAQEALQFMNGFDDPGADTTPSKLTTSVTAQVRSTPYNVTRTPSSTSSTPPVTPTSPVTTIDYQLKMTEEELSLLKEKITILENKRKCLLKEKAFEQKKLGLALEHSHLEEQQACRQQLDFNSKTLKTSPRPLTSGSWSQNRTTKLLDINATRKIHTDATEGRSVVYTDGSCIANGTSSAKAGIGVYWGEDHPLNVSEKLGGRQTNNRAEIFAIVRALQQARKLDLKELVVRTDSQFIINSMTKWVGAWKRNDWKTAKGNDVINKVDFLALLKEMEGITIYWEHVTAHKGILGNERADQLAVQGANS